MLYLLNYLIRFFTLKIYAMEYYYQRERGAVVEGPIKKEELEKMFSSYKLGLNTMIWREGYPKWIKAKNDKELDISFQTQSEIENSYVGRLPYLPPKPPKKDNDAVIVGIILVIVQFVIVAYAANSPEVEWSELFYSSKEDYYFLTLPLFIAFRILVAFWINNIVQRKKLGATFGWIVFSLFLPGISLIISGSFNKRR